MKQLQFIIIFLIVVGLITACGAEAAQPATPVPLTKTTPTQLAEVTPAQPTAAALVEPVQAGPAESPEATPTPVETAPAPAPAAFPKQSNGEMGVQVDVTPLNLADKGDTLDFEVVFSTHVVELSFDPKTISVLRDDTGREVPAVAWEGDGPGGHHREGALRFKTPGGSTEFVEVVIRDVAGVPERVFRWKLTE